VIVILDGVERAELPPWNAAPTPHLATLSELARTATVFDRHRAPTTVVSAAVATLLTGRPPRAHGLTDWAARLPASETTLGGVARDASVRAGMFTGVPFTFRAFGFGGGWERFVETSPVSGDPAHAPIDAASAWITEIARTSSDARMLAVVHARGGHPPWDATAKEIAAAPPPEYTGLVEPRLAAQRIARMRRSKRANAVSEADRQRIRALEQIGLAGQDRALGALVAALKTANLWDSTLLVVTGDVGSGAADLFGDSLDLKEPLLTLPLYVHFPGGAPGGRRITDPTELSDITRTTLAALGLAFSKPTAGRDLARLVADYEEGPFGPQIATIDTRYSARWGDLILTGRFPSPPQLCDLALDPLCAFNRRETMPIAAQALFRSVVAADPGAGSLSRREPATIDTETAAALNVWGAMD
jgi:arylsulfatase A-like enzyme